jgi:putative nucleotidyltransferase with HDIG domain
MKTTPEKLVRRIREVSTLPHIVAQVIEVANNVNTSAIDLAEVVESDPTLAARVLRTVNAAAYGLRNRVTTIVKAISYLGFTEVRKIAITASVSSLFREEHSQGRYDRRRLWKHLVSVGVISRLLAMRCRVENFEEAFLAGLLHDLGIILIDQHLNREFNNIVAALTEEKTTPQIEFEIIGFDHTQVGAEVAEKWRFPPSVVDAMKYHHNANLCQTPNRSLVAVVEVSNVLCTLKGITSMGIQNLATPRSETFQTLGVDRHDLKVMWDDVEASLEQSRVLIEI